LLAGLRKATVPLPGNMAPDTLTLTGVQSKPTHIQQLLTVRALSPGAVNRLLSLKGADKGSVSSCDSGYLDSEPVLPLIFGECEGIGEWLFIWNLYNF